MKVGIYTLGCKVNTYESEYIISEFKKNGYEIADFKDDCDVYVVNTCTVTNNSDKKDRKIINSIKNKKGIKIVCGCFVEYNKEYNYDGIDIVIGNTNKSKIISLLEEFKKTNKQIILKDNIMLSRFEDMKISNFEDRTRAFVKIQDGCENYCSYCVIPFVRGRCRSKSKEKVIEEITELVNNGYKEIVLTGIHTGNYGKDLNISFSDLLKEILTIDNLKRLRISSIEVTELNDDFINLLSNNILCDHLHIPLQSGSDKILKLMNRKYDTAEFEKYIDKIRRVRPNISISTDVIVGFPCEDEENFIETCNFVKKIKFSKIHVFPYSKRDNTKAARMDGQVSPLVKKNRVNILMDISSKLEKEYYDKFKGKKLETLIEKSYNGKSYGHTSNYLYLEHDEVSQNNEFVDVLVK